MAVGQDTARHQGRIFQFAHAKGEVHALSDLVDDPFCDEDLDMDVRKLFWKATTIGASSESEMLGGAASRRFPETFERWLEAMLSIASLISAPRWAYSRTSEPTSVRRRERVERSIKRTPSACSSSA